MIVVVDYCKGNLQSVLRGLVNVGAEACISDDPAAIEAAEALVLPGVGAFADAANTMSETGQMEAIRAAIRAGKPFLGICLGQHLLFEEGYEGSTREALDNKAEADIESPCAGETPEGYVKGIGVLEGCVNRMPKTDDQGNKFKVPHVGWNSIEFDALTDCPLLADVNPGEYFYFTHSYIAPDTGATVATTTHSVTFPSVVRFANRAYGVQFHPEKSSDAGEQILRNFLRIVEQARA